MQPNQLGNVNKEWSWMDCNLTLKRSCKKNQHTIFQILESEYSVLLEEDGTDSELNIEIAMQKKIHCEENGGFTWHKSWNIPSIEVKMSKRDINAVKGQLGVGRVYCEITAGYPVRKMLQFYLQQVPLEGETRKELASNGVARFTNLKFSETSFTHDRNKFSLILIFFTKCAEERSRSILKSFISMPIYVDSRKEARKKISTNSFLSQNISIQAFTEDLLSKHIQKRCKKSSRRRQEQDEEEGNKKGKYLIEYSLEGFIRYYSSANIRNKIKHPFYFCYHFADVVTLYFNNEVFSNPLEILQFLSTSLKPSAKKILLLGIKVSSVETEEIQEIKRKLVSLMESWKYFFIQIGVKGSMNFQHMIEEKYEQKSQNQEKQEITIIQNKWKEITQTQLLNSYVQYLQDIQKQQPGFNKQNADDSEESNPNDLQSNKYQNYELHQTLCIQQGFGINGRKRVKLQQDKQQSNQAEENE